MMGEKAVKRFLKIFFVLARLYENQYTKEKPGPLAEAWTADSRRSKMTKSEILKREILKQYRSVRSFATAMSIPYSTLVTALERGVEGMGYGTVLRICENLNLNPTDFSPLEAQDVVAAHILENQVLQRYLALNAAGREKALEIMEDLALLDKYKARSRKNK